MNELGVVLIGRNEGQRLLTAMASVQKLAVPVVYVDSGSSDGSVAAAEAAGVHAIVLDRSQPFSAARARNTGAEYLLRQQPDLAYLFFMDGDCELLEGFVPAAVRTLEEHAAVGAVCGRRRERYPEASPYNALCEMEWNTPVGPAEEFGGDVLMRAALFTQLGGYNPALIAGEDPELSARMRKAGYTIARIDADMTMHDAAMTSFNQWWKRTMRSGHALAERAHMHGGPPLYDCIRQRRSTVLWGALAPALALGLAIPTAGLSLLLLGAYPVLWFRIYRYRRGRGDTPAQARLYARYCLLAKVPQVCGLTVFLKNRFLGRQSSLIEYKAPLPERAQAHA